MPNRRSMERISDVTDSNAGGLQRRPAGGQSRADSASRCQGPVNHVCSQHQRRKRVISSELLGALVTVAAVATSFSRDWPGLDVIGLLSTASDSQIKTESRLYTDANLRRIMTGAGIIDTLRTPGLDDCSRHDDVDLNGGDSMCSREETRRNLSNQWYIQTRGLLTAQQRSELEADAGLKLGPYFPHSAYLIVGTRGQACLAAKARHVLWIGKRDASQKLDITTQSFNRSWVDNLNWASPDRSVSHLIESMPVALNIGLWPHTRRPKNCTSGLLAIQVASGIMAQFGLETSVRAPALDKLVVETTFGVASEIASWVAQDSYVIGVERKAMFATRNDASNQILVAGPSAVSRSMDTNPLSRAGLNGSGVTIGVADTGLDFDHCMLWQRPFDWFCFDPFDVSFDGMQNCPFSAFAGLLANPDFADFLTMMLGTTKDVPLMSSGRTQQSSLKLAPMDIAMPDRALRQSEGYIFSLANDTSLPVLLGAWRKIREPLLSVLSRDEACDDCGGTIKSMQGVTVFEAKTPVYAFSKKDFSWDAVHEEIGDDWLSFQKILTEKCICFWVKPSPVSVSAIEAWQGPVPPINELLMMTSTPTASIIRKGMGLPALPVELLEGLCNATRGGGMFEVPGPDRSADGVRQDICQNVTFDFEYANETMNLCDLKWEPRAVESALARCVAAEYLKKPVPTSDPFQDRSREYTYNTTLEWWKEYTTLPPFNHMDYSRRMVNAYYTFDGCEACGMCARLRLDSRNFENIKVSKQLPATLVENDMFVMHLQAIDNDWRLDSYEARNVGFSMSLEVVSMQFLIPSVSASSNAQMFCRMLARCHISHFWNDMLLSCAQMTVITGSSSSRFDAAVDVGAVVGFCIMTNSKYETASNVRDRTFWANNCINLGGRFYGNRQQANASILTPFRLSRELDTGRKQYTRSEITGEVPRSADGWRVLAWNNGTSNVVVDTVLKLYTIPTECSDKRDGVTGITENTHSINLGNQNIRSLIPNDQCAIDGRTYCDNTHHSGRQLDLCLVCGGNCFQPGCSKSQCYGQPGNEDQIRVRFLGEFPESIVSKVFKLPSQSKVGIPCPTVMPADTSAEMMRCGLYSSGPGMICPSPTDSEIRCMGAPESCTYLFECKQRIETYDIDTSMLNVEAGVTHTFETGRLIFESASGQNRLIRMRILALTDPAWHLRTGTVLDGRQGGGEIKLSNKFPRLTVADQTFIMFKGMNLTGQQVKERPTEIEVTMNETFIPGFLEGLTYTASKDSGTTMDTRQRMIRIQFQILRPDATPFPVGPGLYGYPGGRAGQSDGPCKPGFTGKACDTIFPPFELRLSVKPADSGQRIVRPENAEGKGGRKRGLSRDGHGTHVVTSIVGRAMHPVVGVSALPSKFDGLAGGAWLAFVDIAKSGNSYLTPPESIGDALFGRPYTEANVRVFLNPWTCEDFVWWKNQDAPFEIEQAVASAFPLNQMANICNRYGADAWEVDDFVARHPDLLVIFPAGDNGVGGANTVSSPGTCKNCLTVGMSHSWSESLAASVDFQLSQCRPQDCPQDFDQTDTCADPKIASPFAIPACCRKKYYSDAFGPGNVDPRSSRGYAVSMQAPFDLFGGNTYTDLSALRFDRVKPDIVAPGVNIVSGRSDGNTGSKGTGGTRCSIDNTGADGSAKDSGCLATMSGSSMAAAKATALAALVRQYFVDGYYPGGLKGFSPRFNPSAALVKAVILASGDEMQKAVDFDAKTTSTDTLPVPNLFYGFGRPRLMSVLKVAEDDGGDSDTDVAAAANADAQQTAKIDPMSICNCSRNNTLLFARALFSDPTLRTPEKLQAAITLDPNGVRFGSDYGIKCAPWNAMRDGRRQQCDNIFSQNPGARQAPPGKVYDPSVYDDTCCISWCFVDEGCPLAQKWDEVSGMFYSTEICKQDKKYEQQCPFQDVSMTREIKTAVFDHATTATKDFNNGTVLLPCNVYPEPELCQYESFEDSLRPERGSISQNESMIYRFKILGASPQQPLVVTMVFTDPVGVWGASSVLVNDLDLQVRTVPLKIQDEKGDLLGWTGGEENRTFSTATLSRDENKSGTVYYGNAIQGGDPGNNAEVVRIKVLPPAEVEVRVYGRRIADTLPGSDGLCQPFALVITGQIDLNLGEEPIPISTDPPELELGICGRHPKKPPPPAKGLLLWQILLIAFGAMLGALLLIFLFYRFMYRWALHKFNGRVNTSQPALVGYLSKLEKAMEEEGIARGGAHDYIILAENASQEDDFYQGLPIVIIGGPGEGESSTIIEYHGRTRRATVEFESNVDHGSKYAIMHDKGLGMGYKIGQSGYMPVGNLPQPDDSLGPLYAKQFDAQALARSAHGNLNSDQLASVGIGKAKRTLSRREQVQQLHAGVHVGEAIGSGDLYQVSVTKPGQEWDSNTVKDSQKVIDYAREISNLITTQEAGHGYRNPDGLTGRNTTSIAKGSQSRPAPPLKGLHNAGTGFKVPGFTSLRRNRTELSKIGQSLQNAKTWETDGFNFDSAFGNPSNPPMEPASTTNLVVATLTTPKNNSNSRKPINTHIHGHSNGEHAANGSAHRSTAHITANGKDTKKLLSKAFD